MMINKIFLLILILPLIGCGQISEEKAVETAKEFVNNEVKLFATNEDSDIMINEATIIIERIVNNENEYQVFFNIQSNQTGELKKSGLVVVVNAKSGEIVRNKVAPYKIS